MCNLLITQDTPEALVLAILCDFKGQDAQEIVNYIVLRLRQLTADNEQAFRNYYEMLETLADNRDLQANLDEAKNMLTQVDITRFASYRWGVEATMRQLQPLLDEKDQALLNKERLLQAEQKRVEEEKQRVRRGVQQLAQMNTLTHQAIADIFQLSLAEVESILADQANGTHGSVH